jgi:hypothetical protein
MKNGNIQKNQTFLKLELVKVLLKKFLMVKKISSYENPEFTIIQCDGKGENVDGASRSIELWELTKSRFPATSMKAMVKILFEIIQEDQSVVLVWCDKFKSSCKYVLNTSAQWITNYSVKKSLQ